ncbi:MAG: galactokinase [Chloroflexota bacterium]|nr:galactokinase [Chloroflexota bacterium]
MPSASTSASAPGRVNRIGEHTDYNGGFVLPTAIPQQTYVELRPRPDRHVVARSREGSPDGTFVVGQERRQGHWFDYVQGLTWALQRGGFRLANGFDLQVRSDVPLGGGLSSSASLEVAVLRALRSAFGLDLDDVRLAQLGQLAENEFVGARCGIMDQMAASLADSSTALFLDTRSLAYRRLPLPAQADLVVIHSGVTHQIADSSGGGGIQSEYNARRADCERAAELLGVPQLRDLRDSDLDRLQALPERLARRARHVITENERVLQAVAAIEAADVARLGALFMASHSSMRDDFEVSTVEIDVLVELAAADDDVYGARLTGGGFGGAVVILARGGRGRAVGERVAGAYRSRSGHPPTVLVP